MLKIEFFHDVICSFCFPMSNRMRKISKKYNNIEIIHRSFALGWEPEDFVRSFGSRQAVKGEVLSHWEQANQNDDDHRFNIDGMRETDFDFPTSKPGLKAAKAAGILHGQVAYWDFFDKLQEKLFVENENVEDLGVIREAVAEAGLDLEEWQAQYDKAETEEAVIKDLQLAQAYGVYSAPTLVINQKYAIPGAQPQDQLELMLQEVAEKEGTSLTKLTPLTDLTGGQGPACRLVDGKMICD